MFNASFMVNVFQMEEIKKKRKDLGISQAKMAKILKVGLNTYQRYERKNDLLLSQAITCTTFLQKIEKVTQETLLS